MKLAPNTSLRFILKASIDDQRLNQALQLIYILISWLFDKLNTRSLVYSSKCRYYRGIFIISLKIQILGESAQSVTMNNNVKHRMIGNDIRFEALFSHLLDEFRYFPGFSIRHPSVSSSTFFFIEILNLFLCQNVAYSFGTSS